MSSPTGPTGVFRRKDVGPPPDDGPLERSVGLIGQILYALYGYRHSKLGRGDEAAGEPEAELK